MDKILLFDEGTDIGVSVGKMKMLGRNIPYIALNAYTEESAIYHTLILKEVTKPTKPDTYEYPTGGRGTLVYGCDESLNFTVTKPTRETMKITITSRELYLGMPLFSAELDMADISNITKESLWASLQKWIEENGHFVFSVFLNSKPLDTVLLFYNKITFADRV